MNSLDELREHLKEEAKAQDLIFLGIVPLSSKRYQDYVTWLEKGYHGQMHYLENNMTLRQNPTQLLGASGSALIFAINYKQEDSVFQLKTQSAPSIAQYARLKDYHRFLKQRLNQILMNTDLFRGLTSKVCVDSIPILEKDLASQTALGFIGKNTLYIHPNHGSLLLLGEILVPLSLTFDDKTEVNPSLRQDIGGCGSCKRCQVYCPTGALDEAYVLDSRKCLSYLTIEHRGPIPLTYWPHLKTYFFGCDLCQLVCPYNKKTPKGTNLPLLEKLKELDLFKVATMNQNFYEASFGGSPLTRAKIDGLKRNALIALVVQKDTRLADALAILSHEKASVIRDTIAQIPEYYRSLTK